MQLIAFLLLQSATPYGSPAPDILLPSKTKDEAATAPADKPTATMSPAEKRFNHCLDLALEDPSKGIAEATAWHVEGGGYFARHCLGFAYAEQFQWAAAASAFAEAARGAELAKDRRAAKFWAQAGNAAFAGGQTEAALGHLNAALVQGTLKGLEKGEVHLDLARVHVALDDYASARGQFASAHELAPQDPLGWLLSATLARRMGDFELARTEIAKAAKLAPRDPAIALEAGNIAYQAGDAAGAKTNWEQAVAINPDSEPAKAAASYLGQLIMTVEE